MRKAVIVITGSPVKMLKEFKENTLDFLYQQEDLSEYEDTVCSRLIDEIQVLESESKDIYKKLSNAGKRRYNLVLRKLEHLVAVETLEKENNPQRVYTDKILTQAERCELFGMLIDTVEDWLEEKGITVDDIPNEERVDEYSAIIYGTDYDALADRFSEILGIRRDDDGLSENKPVILTAGVIRELMSGVNIPTLYSLVRGKKNNVLLDVIDRDDYIATKLWSVADIEGKLIEKGFKPSAENVALVLNTGQLETLGDCTDYDWEIINTAIWNVREKLTKK